MAEYEYLPAKTAIKMLCDLYVEKINREQTALINAAVEVEQELVAAGYKLDIQNGVWVRPKEVVADVPSTEIPHVESHA